MKKIVLASTSPRRKELLKSIFNDFVTISPVYDENITTDLFSFPLIENIAKNKLLSVLKFIDFSALIISADTIVVHQNKILGKPANRGQAFEMLSKLSGSTHFVVTSVCLFDTQTNKLILKSDKSDVKFNKLTNEQIFDYIDKFKPFDKAGSYGIQELPKEFINSTCGDTSNIIGLPLNLIKGMLKEIELY